MVEASKWWTRKKCIWEEIYWPENTLKERVRKQLDKNKTRFCVAMMYNMERSKWGTELSSGLGKSVVLLDKLVKAPILHEIR